MNRDSDGPPSYLKTSGDSGPPPSRRDKWVNRIETKAALLAATWSMADFTHFVSYMLYRGGVVLLLPFLLFLALVAVPMMLLEVSVGQFMERGTLRVWNMAPLLRAVGFCVTVINAHYVWYHVSSMALVGLIGYDVAAHAPALMTPVSNSTDANATGLDPYDYDYGSFQSTLTHLHQMTQDRWRYHWNQEVAGEMDPGKVVMLIIALLAVSLLSGLGSRVVGKFAIVCFVFTQLTVVMLLIRVFITDGATGGLRFLFQADFYQLADIHTWLSGGGAAMNTLHTGLGTLITVGSYNHFRNNFVLDCILATILKLTLGLLPGLVMLGCQSIYANVMDSSFHDVRLGWGSEVAITVETLLHLPGGGFWAAIFMISLLLLSINSAFWSFETVIVAVHDLLPATPRYSIIRKKAVLSAVLCVPLLFWGLGYCTDDVQPLFILSSYSLSYSALFTLSLLHCAGAAWVYGPRRLQASWAAMLGSCGCPYTIVFLAVLTPLLLLVLFILTMLVVSFWIMGVSEICGLVMILLVVVIYAVVYVATRPGSLRQKWRTATTPLDLLPHQLTNRDCRRQAAVAMETIDT